MHTQIPVTPQFDFKRVTSIRTKLDKDDYTVDLQQVADKFIDLERALSGIT